MRWSKNVTSNKPPLWMKPEDFDQNTRAYPYVTEHDGAPFISVTNCDVRFRGQIGPIKEAGVNGCQVDDILTFALGTLRTFNMKFPCRENSLAITHIEEALHWLEARRSDREARDVEGFNKK